MKVDLYNAIVSAQMSRRKMLKGSASLGAVAAMGGLGGAATAGAHGGVRAEIMKIPGVGWDHLVTLSGKRLVNFAWDQ